MLTTYISLIVTGLLWGGVYLLMANGLNLIYGVMCVVNLAHGDFVVAAGLFTFSAFALWAIPPIAAFPIAAIALFIVGYLVSKFIVDKVNVGDNGELYTLLGTFGLSYIVSNVALLLWGAQYQSVPFLQQSFMVGSVPVPKSLLVAAVVAFAVALGVEFWLRRTRTGKTVRAVADSELGAVICALNVKRIKLLTFAIGSAMAGVAGALIISLMPLSAAAGPTLTIQAFSVIALGGLGNYKGAFIAAELLGLIDVTVSYFFGSNAASAAFYVVFIVVLLALPRGLFGGKVRL